jgi:hypothetical protein
MSFPFIILQFGFQLEKIQRSVFLQFSVFPSLSFTQYTSKICVEDYVKLISYYFAIFVKAHLQEMEWALHNFTCLAWFKLSVNDNCYQCIILIFFKFWVTRNGLKKWVDVMLIWVWGKLKTENEPRGRKDWINYLPNNILLYFSLEISKYTIIHHQRWLQNFLM